MSTLLSKAGVSSQGHKPEHDSLEDQCCLSFRIFPLALVDSVQRKDRNSSTIWYQVSCKSCQQNVSVSIRLSEGIISRFFYWQFLPLAYTLPGLPTGGELIMVTRACPYSSGPATTCLGARPPLVPQLLYPWSWCPVP